MYFDLPKFEKYVTCKLEHEVDEYNCTRHKMLWDILNWLYKIEIAPI